MNSEAQKIASKEAGAKPIIVDLRDRVPHMEDAALVTLKANALRLVEQGTSAQRVAAGDLLPVVEAEIARRRAEKIASLPPKAPRAAKKKQAARTAAD